MGGCAKVEAQTRVGKGYRLESDGDLEYEAEELELGATEGCHTEESYVLRQGNWQQGA